ncbi:peptidase M9 [Streptomyces albus subsp. albus]|nr:peptidase M9 [Streptomyces albus subsp. albus]
MFKHRPVRSCVLATAVAAAVLATAAPAVQAAGAASTAPATFRAAPAATPAAHPYDEVERLAKAPRQTVKPAPAPGHLAEGRIPGPQKPAKAKAHRAADAPAPRTAAGVPCTLDGISGLAPEAFADFLTDPAVTAEGCLRGLIWTWDARLARVMSDAHVQAVSRRISSLAASHDGRDSTHLLEMFTYLHAVIYHDFSRGEIDTTDAATTDAIRGAIDAFGAAAHTFDATASNAETLREALYAGTGPGLRQHQLGLIKKVLATMDRSHPATNTDAKWGGAALAALSVNYLGVYPGNRDTAFHTAAAGDDSYRAAFKAFAGYTHLKGTPNEWVVRDAVMEYGRFGQIDALRDRLIPDLGGTVLPTVETNFGRGSEPWIKTVSWLTTFGSCKPYSVCKEDIEKWLFPNTYIYDNGGIKVRTALSRATVDQLYYASKQVKAQFHRVLGTEQPLAGDPNATLNIVLYASRADYENYHPLLTGMGTENGGVYIEKGATFYTYQRRVPQDSSLTLEELFRHEYVHYLNGRFAVPGSYGQGAWYQNDRTTAMDEGTAEFFDGATRSDGIAARRSLVKSVIADTAGGGPRMTVNQLLHAEYARDGFRFYPYAGTFFEYLWTERPGVLREMYRHIRANDPVAFDAWRDHLGTDSAIQREYDRFLDARIAEVDRLFVPDTKFTPNDQLRDSSVAAVRSAFASATYQNPDCVENGDSGKRRFICTGRITANLSNAGNPDQVFKDMSETVDYFILDRAGTASNNLADMNCSFGEVDIWSDKRAGTSAYTCEGPLRS